MQEYMRVQDCNQVCFNESQSSKTLILILSTTAFILYRCWFFTVSRSIIIRKKESYIFDSNRKYLYSLAICLLVGSAILSFFHDEMKFNNFYNCEYMNGSKVMAMSISKRVLLIILTIMTIRELDLFLISTHQMLLSTLHLEIRLRTMGYLSAGLMLFQYACILVWGDRLKGSNMTAAIMVTSSAAMVSTFALYTIVELNDMKVTNVEYFGMKPNIAMVQTISTVCLFKLLDLSKISAIYGPGTSMTVTIGNFTTICQVEYALVEDSCTVGDDIVLRCDNLSF